MFYFASLMSWGVMDFTQFTSWGWREDHKSPAFQLHPPLSPPRALYACKVFISLKQEGSSLPHRLQKRTLEQPVLWSLFCAKRRAVLGKGYLSPHCVKGEKSSGDMPAN